MKNIKVDEKVQRTNRWKYRTCFDLDDTIFDKLIGHKIYLQHFCTSGKTPRAKYRSTVEIIVLASTPLS